MEFKQVQYDEGQLRSKKRRLGCLVNNLDINIPMLAVLELSKNIKFTRSQSSR